MGGPEIAPADTSKAMSDAKDAYGYDEDDEFYVDEESKAVSDVNTVPTAAMARNAERGLELRAQYGRGGTIIGVTRANQLKDRENLSPSTVKRMNSYFARHEVDKEAQGFRRGEEGWPSAGVVAWLLWGGDEGQTWARTKVKELELQQGKSTSIAAE